MALAATWPAVARLMFASGFVKLASGDATWSSLRALDAHFETQPLPVGLSVALHFGPAWLRTCGAALTLVVELVLPFAILLGTVGRRIAAAGFASLMVLVALTGNYGFFNLLTIALVVPLLDDALLERALRAMRVNVGTAVDAVQTTVWRRLSQVAPSVQAALGALMLASTLGARVPLPDPIASLHLASPYGLFAVMTTERPIVIFEGTDDGETWRAYDYRYQSGDPSRSPAQCFPHMPRLDWMIWFAGLADPEGTPWITAVERGLLEARPDVLALFGRDPFDGSRPRRVRAVRYLYTFAPPDADDAWTRTDRAPYGPERGAP